MVTISILAIALATIARVTDFSMIARAGSDGVAYYGDTLSSKTPGSINSTYSGWSWEDSETDYFGTVGNQTFVITKDSKYQNLTVNVQPRTIVPIIKTGSSTSTVPTTWTGNTSKAIAHTVTVSSNNTSYGTVSQSSSTGIYKEGTQYTITATPKTNYKFVKWSDNNTSVSRTITMGSSDISYTATFESNYIETEAGKIDPNGIVHLTGRAISVKYPYLASGYNYLIWSGSYSAVNLPTTYAFFSRDYWTQTNETTGLMGRLIGAGSYGSTFDGDTVQWFNSSGSYQKVTGYDYVSNVFDSTFTLAPIV